MLSLSNSALQVVDHIDDDSWGLSAALPVGVEASSVNTDSDSSAATKLGLVIGLCAGGEGGVGFVDLCVTKSVHKCNQENVCFGLSRTRCRVCVAYFVYFFTKTGRLNT